jgi:predicted phosphatase
MLNMLINVYKIYTGPLSLLTWNSALYSLGADPIQNVSQQFVGVFTAPLPRIGRPLSRIVVRINQQRALYQASVSAERVYRAVA